MDSSPPLGGRLGRQALALEPGSREITCELALSLLRQGRPGEAELLLEPFLDASPHAVQPYCYVLVEGYQLPGGAFPPNTPAMWDVVVIVSLPKGEPIRLATRIPAP